MVQGEPDERRNRVEPWVWWLLGGVGVALAALLVVSLTGGDDTPTTTTIAAATTEGTTSTTAATTTSESTTTTTGGPGETPGEVFAEPAGTPGPDPFTTEELAAPVVSTTAPVGTMPPTTTTEATTTTTSASGEAPPPPVVLTGVAGDQPGLYGGTRDSSRCDKAAMLQFLQQNPDKAAAWVEAQNADPTLLWDDGRTTLTVEDLPAFFDELTPVTLLFDTRVTNHGFRNGRPTPRQSVLQAGTAVLVDAWGVPRAKCACGNPLIPPLPSPRPPTWVGPTWPGFDPTVIVVVNQSITVIEQFIIVDVTIGNTIIRPVGSIGDLDGDGPSITVDTTPLTIPDDIEVGGGDVQATLIWATDSDLDLHVIDPDGTEIYWINTSSPSGGQLDVDAIPDRGDTGPHVENVFWPPGESPPGAYEIFVEHFSSYDGSLSSYTLEVRIDGELIHSETGVLAEDAQSTPFEILIDMAP